MDFIRDTQLLVAYANNLIPLLVLSALMVGLSIMAITGCVLDRKEQQKLQKHVQVNYVKEGFVEGSDDEDDDDDDDLMSSSSRNTQETIRKESGQSATSVLLSGPRYVFSSVAARLREEGRVIGIVKPDVKSHAVLSRPQRIIVFCATVMISFSVSAVFYGKRQHNFAALLVVSLISMILTKPVDIGIPLAFKSLQKPLKSTTLRVQSINLRRLFSCCRSRKTLKIQTPLPPALYGDGRSSVTIREDGTALMRVSVNKKSPAKKTMPSVKPHEGGDLSTVEKKMNQRGELLLKEKEKQVGRARTTTLKVAVQSKSSVLTNDDMTITADVDMPPELIRSRPFRMLPMSMVVVAFIYFLLGLLLLVGAIYLAASQGIALGFGGQLAFVPGILGVLCLLVNAIGMYAVRKRKRVLTRLFAFYLLFLAGCFVAVTVVVILLRENLTFREEVADFVKADWQYNVAALTNQDSGRVAAVTWLSNIQTSLSCCGFDIGDVTAEYASATNCPSDALVLPCKPKILTSFLTESMPAATGSIVTALSLIVYSAVNFWMSRSPRYYFQNPKVLQKILSERCCQLHILLDGRAITRQMLVAGVKIQTAYRGYRDRQRSIRMRELKEWRERSVVRKVLLTLVYGISFAIILFCFYINLVFGVKFDAATANSWLATSLVAILVDMLLRKPVTIVRKAIQEVVAALLARSH